MIRNGLKETEVCAFKMTENFDEGDVLLREKLSLEGDLEEILNKIRSIISIMIKRIRKEEITYKPVSITLPMNFNRIVNNHLPETETLEKLYNEIRMRDDEHHPKAHIYHGRYTIEFTRASMRDGHIEANARILQK